MIIDFFRKKQIEARALQITAVILDIFPPDAIGKKDFTKKQKKQTEKILNEALHQAENLLSVITIDMRLGFYGKAIICKYIQSKLNDLRYPPETISFIIRSLAVKISKNTKEILERPEESYIYFVTGILHTKLKEYDKSKNCYLKVLNTNPNHINALNNLGELYRRDGNSELALKTFDKILEIDPQFIGAFINKGIIYDEKNELDLAAEYYNKALKLYPKSPEAHNNLGLTLFRKQKKEEAKTHFKKAISFNSLYPDAYYNLGSLYFSDENYEMAIEYFLQALSKKEDYPEALNNLGLALKQVNLHKESVQSLEKANRLKPDDANTIYNLALSYKELGRTKDAIDKFNYAISLNPNVGEYILALGNTYQDSGEQDLAIKCYEESLHSENVKSKACRHLSLLKPEALNIQNIEKLLQDTKCSSKDLVQYNFTLGNLYNLETSFDDAFKYYKSANDIIRESIEYDQKEITKSINKLIETYSSNFFSERANWGNESTLPIFILGMPRSGTTLVEQIISSHPKVFGAGELYNIPKTIKSVDNESKENIPYPECMKSLNEKTVLKYSEEVLEGVKEFSKDNNYQHITDKMPGNFTNIGFINTLFKSPRIIHCKRNALDTCTSIYFTYLTVGHHYSFNLIDLGQYYLEYEKIMSHWNNIFKDKIFEVDYETLVENQEEVSRQLLEYIGLDWDNRCLNFENNIRAVRTASNLQVRKPMYKSSLNKWKRYEKGLRPLIEILPHHT